MWEPLRMVWREVIDFGSGRVTPCDDKGPEPVARSSPGAGRPGPTKTCRRVWAGPLVRLRNYRRKSGTQGQAELVAIRARSFGRRVRAGPGLDYSRPRPRLQSRMLRERRRHADARHHAAAEGPRVLLCSEAGARRNLNDLPPPDRGPVGRGVAKSGAAGVEA
ncbi:unnamed protein product, partial [Amoebophrya sp. A120]|eukprot:GSA120T00021431001.1